MGSHSSPPDSASAATAAAAAAGGYVADRGQEEGGVQEAERRAEGETEHDEGVGEREEQDNERNSVKAKEGYSKDGGDSNRESDICHDIALSKCE